MASNVLKIKWMERVRRDLGNVLRFRIHFGIVVKIDMFFEPNSPILLITNILSHMEVR